jgi:pantetheine-phosphate adenylyltransferase
MTTAVYCGSFDPVTNGHVDIATRAARMFSKLVIGVFDTPAKNLLFTTAERVAMVKEAIRDYPNIDVDAYDGLTVDFAHRMEARVMVRGLRAVTDFELEFQMNSMNRHLSPDVDTVCLFTSLPFSYISSGLIKEVSRLGGDLDEFVPPHVRVALEAKLAARGLRPDPTVDSYLRKSGSMFEAIGG